MTLPAPANFTYSNDLLTPAGDRLFAQFPVGLRRTELYALDLRGRPLAHRTLTDAEAQVKVAAFAGGGLILATAYGFERLDPETLRTVGRAGGRTPYDDPVATTRHFWFTEDGRELTGSRYCTVDGCPRRRNLVAYDSRLQGGRRAATFELPSSVEEVRFARPVSDGTTVWLPARGALVGFGPP